MISPHYSILLISSSLAFPHCLHISLYMAGYRDILLNISIENEHTKLLGINRHICELQLTLDIFHVRFCFWCVCGGGDCVL